MIKICTVEHDGSEWFYDAADDCYIRKGASCKVGKLSRKNLSDPHRRWAAICKYSGIPMNSADALEFKPLASTFALWAHKQGISND